jgi:3-phenylpropionate/trans-cinnamate dioxygenase ferredoxin reductase subunit
MDLSCRSREFKRLSTTLASATGLSDPDGQMESHTLRVLIIGAGHAGGSVAGFLRLYGFEGPITLIGDEPIPPYQRPPLSKAWLKGEADADSLQLKDPAWWAETGCDLRLGQTVTHIDRAARTVTVNGEALPYDALVIATGARARRIDLVGASLDGVLFLRTAADAEALKPRLGPRRRLAVIGGGYVGLEAAASATALGGSAVVLEREARVLARVASEPLSAFYQAAHARRGVEILTGASVVRLEGDGSVAAVVLADGRRIACDTVLVGVGAIANTELAEAAGLNCRDGVIVDAAARTTDPAIWAVGDVTRRPGGLFGGDIRFESVPNALEQAKQAAAAIAGRDQPPAEVPWFWSDQFDLKLQMAGLARDSDRLVLRGDPDTERFAVFHLKGNVIRCVEAVNAPPEFMAGRMLIGKQTPVDAARLADPAISMKEVTAT